MLFEKFKTFAQVVGFVTIGLLALLGVLGLAKGSSPVLAAVGLAPAAPQAATVPEVMNYQGILKDADGNPLNGSYTMTFRIYDEPEGGNNLCEETHANVTVRDGHFNVLLGYSVPLSAELFSSPDRYIGVTVDPYDEMYPRQRFATVPYAFHANRAFGLSAADGDPLDAVTVDDDGKVGIGTTSPSVPLHVRGGSDASLSGGGYFVAGSTTAGNIAIDNNEIMARNNGSASPLYLNKDGGDVHIGGAKLEVNGQIRAKSGAPSGNVTTHGYTFGDGGDLDGGMFSDADNTLKFATNGTTRMTIEGGYVGIGTTDPSKRLDVSGSANVSGDIAWGGHLGSMTLSEEYHVEAPGSTGWNVVDMGSAENSICFLVGVAVNDVDDKDEWVKCAIDKEGEEGGHWKLKAYGTDDDDDAWCEARCLSW